MLIKIKPLSINACFQGRKFKTPAYNRYERDVLLMLPNIMLPEPPYNIKITYGFSSTLADIDNPTKPILDILQKKYGFNDRDIYRLELLKVIVDKNDEFVKIEFL